MVFGCRETDFEECDDPDNRGVAPFQRYDAPIMLSWTIILLQLANLRDEEEVLKKEKEMMSFPVFSLSFFSALFSFLCRSSKRLGKKM